MPQELKIGLIGLDTSHVVAFSKLLNRDDDPYNVAGARVVAGYPGGTPDWEISASRVDGFTAQLGDEFGVSIEEEPEAVAEQSDLVFITAVDGRDHRRLFERVVGAGKPIFIDKPFATTVADAQAMIDGAKAAGIPLMSCSSLRYAEAFTKALKQDELGEVVGIDVFGPMALQDGLPGLFWYGCHGIEMVVAAMGAGCESLAATATERADVIAMRWADGRVASYRGLREAHSRFGATIHRSQGFQTVDVASESKPYYASLLEAILRSLPKGQSDVPANQMLEVVRLMVAGNESRRTDQFIALDAPAVT